MQGNDPEVDQEEEHADERASLLRRVFREINADDVTGQAAKMAYFMFTSLPPALLVLFALSGFLGGESMAGFLREQLGRVIPGSANDPDSAAGFLNRFIEEVALERAPAALSIGVVLGLWSASNVFVGLTDSLNTAYDLEETRSWIRRRALALGVMLLFVILFLVGSATLIIGPQVAEAVRLGAVAEMVWSIVQWPIAFLLIAVAFFLVYSLLPNHKFGKNLRAMLISSVIATGLWLVATIGFRIYIAEFGSYNVTYGFIGAILVLLLWMYLTAMVILIGGEIGSELVSAR